MMTQLEQARAGQVSAEMAAAAKQEQAAPDALRERIAAGTAVLPHNRNRNSAVPCAVGAGLRTKVNANLGTSRDYPDLDKELAKLQAAESAGAHTVMDLSTGGDLVAIRREILAHAHVPLGTVPIYEAAVNAVASQHSIVDMTAGDMLSVIEQQAREGVDFQTVHCGVTRAALASLDRAPRVCGIVSRGGSFIAEWVRYNERENPLYEQFDDILAITREHDVTLSLGDGLRPGALADAMDAAQMHELMILGELVQRCHEAGVQVMVEGPGHVPLAQVESQMHVAKKLCDGAPLYVLGPLVTDVAPGYDHIVAAIGGALAAAAGADFLCYVTPAEHLGLPTCDDVRTGVIAARIAAHAADIAKGVPGAAEWDRRLSELRHERDWPRLLDMSLDPDTARRHRQAEPPTDDGVCSMCGEYCAFKIAGEASRARGERSAPTRTRPAH